MERVCFLAEIHRFEFLATLMNCSTGGCRLDKLRDTPPFLEHGHLNQAVPSSFLDELGATYD
jgi:hypothetical protein